MDFKEIREQAPNAEFWWSEDRQQWVSDYKKRDRSIAFAVLDKVDEILKKNMADWLYPILKNQINALREQIEGGDHA